MSRKPHEWRLETPAFTAGDLEECSGISRIFGNENDQFHCHGSRWEAHASETGHCVSQCKCILSVQLGSDKYLITLRSRLACDCPWNLRNSSPSFSCVHVMCACVHVHMYVYKCMCTWRPEVGNPPPLLFYLIH